MNSKANLIGMLLTDGCVRNSPRKHAVIFSNKSEILCNAFKKFILENYGEQHFGEYTDKYGVKSTSVNKKAIVEDLLKFSKTYKTKITDGKITDAHIPKMFWNLSKENLAEVFRYIFSCDGSVSLGIKWHKRFRKFVLTRKVSLSCNHPVLISDYKKILKKKFGLNFKQNKTEIVIESLNDIRKFKEEIGFVDGVKISKKSKNWEGFDKNKILDILTKTYGNPNFINFVRNAQPTADRVQVFTD